MMLSQVTQRLDNLKDNVKLMAARAFSDLVRETVAGIVSVGSPRPGTMGTQTIGLHLPETMRLQLLNEQKRWGLKTYRDVSYVALNVGLELLRASATVDAVPSPTLVSEPEPEDE